MNRTVRALLTGLFVLGVCASSFAQLYPVPAKTPNTVANCATCGPGGGAGQTVGYTTPLTTYTGRFLDSTYQGDWFRPFRTARAYQVLIMPSLDRIYFRYGNGTVAAYQLSTFFTRLESSEALVWPSSIAVPGDRSGNPEKWLLWASWFNPEMATPAWKLSNADGSIRMPWFDVDDRAYVYIASTIYGWGLAKDDPSLTSGSSMRSVFQKYPSGAGAASPTVIAALKSGTKYYAYLSGGTTPLWDVTSPTAPVAVNVAVPPLPAIYAKNSTSDRFAVVDATGKLSIYDVGSFASGAAPRFSAPGYSQVASDGTNFFALKAPTPNPTGPGGLSSLDVYSTTGTLLASNPITVMITSGGGVTAMRVAENVVVMSGLDGGSWDMQAYKLSGNYVPTRLPINSYPIAADGQYPSYFRNYYVAPPAGYTAPTSGSINIYDGTVYKAANGNLYLIFCGKGLGDVYQLQAGDSISPRNDGAKGSPNPYAPAPAAGTVFYGDPVQFTGTTQSQNLTQLVWDLGNLEGGTANTQYSAPNAPFTYQYSNLTKTTIGTRTVKASSVSDANVKGTVTVNLQAPVARFGISGPTPLKYLFAAPNASSPAPIVLGDTFSDASDGTVQSHYTAWTLDDATAKGVPTDTLPVGACGSHSLTFQAFYGPYSGAAATLATLHPANSVVTNPPDFIVGLDPNNPANSTFNYTTRPFAAVLEVQSTDPTYVYFSGANSRGLTSSAVTVAQGFTWTWEVVDSSGHVWFGPQSGAGPTIAQFAVPKTTFTQTQNLQARLTLTTNTPLQGSCAGLETTVAISAPMNAPSPVVTQSGNCQTQLCTFAVGSTNGIDPIADHWTYSWLVNGAAPDGVSVSAPTATSSTFSPVFLKPGTYNITVSVTNAIGNGTAAAPSNPITITAPACAKLASDSFQPVYQGASSGCSSAPYSNPCASNELVTFQASLNGYAKTPYNPSCSVTTYKWTFPDNNTATTTDPIVSVDRNVTASGTVKLTVSNSTGDTHDYTVAISVGTVTPPPPPPGNNCSGMSGSNVFPAISGGGCTLAAGGYTCTTGAALSFTVQTYLYDSGCLTNATGWNFGDGGASSGVTVTHAYGTAKTYSGTVVIRNSANEAPVTKTFSVTTVASTPGGSCGTMTDGAIHIMYSGNSCATGSTCAPNDSLTFLVQAAGYDLNCAPHNYTWNFGDGGNSTQSSPQHAYSAAGTYNGSVTITNTATNQSLTKSFHVAVGATGGACSPVTPNITLSITYSNPSGTCGPLGGACGVSEPLNFTVVPYLYDMNCAAHTFDWDFGDGSPHGTTKDVTHQYQAGGTFTAHCTVNNGANITLTQVVTISGSGGSITVQPSIAIDSMDKVANGFIFYAHFDHPEAVAKWQWNFGDGRSNAIQNVTGNAADPDPVAYIYADSKAYTVTLTAYGANGQAVGTDNAPNAPTGPPKRRSVRH